MPSWGPPHPGSKNWFLNAKVNRKTVESGGLEVAQVWVSSLGSLIRARIVDCTKVDRETLAVNRKP